MTVSAPRSFAVTAIVAQRAGDERVDHVERGHVDDDPARAEAADALGEVVAELDHLACRSRARLDRRDQVVALPEDRDRHRALRLRRPASGSSSRMTSVAEQALRLLEPALQIADRPHHAESTPRSTSVCAISGREPGDDRAARPSAATPHRLHEVVRDRHVDRRHAGDVDDDDLRAIRLDRASSCSVSWRARGSRGTPMIGRISSRSRTCSTGVESSRIAACCSRMTRSRSSTKLTPTVTAIRFAAGS